MRDAEASNTAILIARSILFWSLDRNFRHLVPDGAVPIIERCLSAAGFDVPRERRKLGSAFGRFLVSIVERIILPGINLHYLLRKRMIEETVLRAIADGVRQVVVLGAGFDTLATRLHTSHPEVSFVEVDHPATQRVKEEAICDLAAANLQLIPADLMHTRLKDALAPSTLRSDVSTVVVAEGVLMYLNEHRVAHLFEDVREMFVDVQFVFTFMHRDRGVVSFVHRRRYVDLLLKLKGEAFLWGPNLTTGIVPWLKDRGFDAVVIETPSALKAKYIAAELARLVPRPDGDTICLAVPSRGASG